MEYERVTMKNGLLDCAINCGSEMSCIGCAGNVTRALVRLAELEDKIEAGTLVELPCKEGDIVYFVNWYRPTPRIEAFKVSHLEVNKNYIYVACYDFENEYNYSMYRMNSKDISFTKAEAEKRLEEIRNGNNNRLSE